MSPEKTEEVMSVMYETLSTTLPLEYVLPLCGNIVIDVIEDIESSADPEFNDDDVRLAMGRVLVSKTSNEV